MNHTPIDRRAIPSHARESRWQAGDGWQIRRIDWPVPDVPRGSILFLPGRGDAYEKYLETLEEWSARATRHAGSWWRDWATWLTRRSGRLVPARVPGEGGLPALEAAPGSYVCVRSVPTPPVSSDSASSADAA